MFDTRRVPQLLEQPVAKTKREQILYGFLSEIVVYSERPLLGERAEHGIVDVVKGREVLTKGLLKPDARLAPGQPNGLKPGDGRLEQGRPGRKQNRKRLRFAVAERLRQGAK